MHTHKIHDLSDDYVVNLLKKGLSNITDDKLIKNYHPDNASTPSNLFFVLNQGRYKDGRGAYYVMENDGEYIGSGGWNEYDLDNSVALVLTRMYITSSNRKHHFIGHELLKNVFREAWKDIKDYEHVWITVNNYNKPIYDWFNKVSKSETALFSEWPEIKYTFNAVGIKEIYYTDQYVIELK